MDKTYGSISFSGKDIATPGVQYDRLAMGNRGQLYLVSLVAETHRVKQIRAILCGGAKCSIQAEGGRVKQKSTPDWSGDRNPGSVYACEEGYKVYTQKLDFGLAHALFITRESGFMPVVSQEALWQELNTDRFTTPIIREWLPYIETRLRQAQALEEAYTFGCDCGFLTASTKTLDSIVEGGLMDGNISIPRTNPEPEKAAA